jgi:hypothetical protein
VTLPLSPRLTDAERDEILALAEPPVVVVASQDVDPRQDRLSR